MVHYQKPDWFTGNIFNRAVQGLTEWVRNIRVSGEGELLLGGRTQRFKAHEIADDDKVALLRAYLKRWKLEVGQFYGGVGADASGQELRWIAPDHPAFLVEPLS